MSLGVRTALFLISSVIVCSCQVAQKEGQSRRGPNFDFRSNVWVNLHHYLYSEAFRSQWVAQPIDKLDSEDKTKLKNAVAYYQKNFKKRDLLFDKGLTEINSKLSAIEPSARLKDSGISDDLRVVLEDASPVYEKHLWPAQSRENQVWIEKAKALLDRYGSQIQERLERDLLRKFPDSPHRIDVVHDAHWSGAYTYAPAHTVISSGRASYSGLAALEMIFHEYLHTDAFGEIQGAIDQSFADVKKKDSLQLWHAVLFTTAAEEVQDVLRENGNEYTPYAMKNGLFATEREWGKLAPLLQKYWIPYLRGKREMKSAISELVRASQE